MPPRLRFLLGLTLFTAAISASSHVGIPHDGHGHDALPSIALGWRLLFHVLRATTLAATTGGIALITWRGAHGEWPIRFGQVEYAPERAAAHTSAALDHQEQRLRLVEAQLRLQRTRLAAEDASG